MTHTITAQFEHRAVKANGMRFGLHAMATITEFSDVSATAYASVAMHIGHESLETPLSSSFTISSGDARALAAALIRYADLADAKCVELTTPEAA